MKKEEVEYLYLLKEKNGISKEQIVKELKRDKEFQKKLDKLKKNEKKKHKETILKAKEVNKTFKEEFVKLK